MGFYASIYKTRVNASIMCPKHVKTHANTYVWDSCPVQVKTLVNEVAVICIGFKGYSYDITTIYIGF